MKINHSLFTRRVFLNGLLGGWLAGLASAFISPFLKYVFPPVQEPDKVTLPLADVQGLPADTFKAFAWGNKPALVKKMADGSFFALIAVCTHLDCNVTYVPAQKRFYWACHGGWYDENGRNIAGPPPAPLRRLAAAAEGDTLVIRKQG